MTGCKHSDDEVEVYRSKSWTGGGDFYCSACGHWWIAGQEEVEAWERRILFPTPRTLEDMEDEDAEAH